MNKSNKLSEYDILNSAHTVCQIKLVALSLTNRIADIPKMAQGDFLLSEPFVFTITVVAAMKVHICKSLSANRINNFYRFVFGK